MRELNVGQPEITTQERVIKLFEDKIGYTYLENWIDRENSNIEKEDLFKFLRKQVCSEVLIEKAFNKLQKTATNQNNALYDTHKEVYSLLRYGIKVREQTGHKHQTVWPIDWKHPLNNDFYIAEEVSIRGQHN